MPFALLACSACMTILFLFSPESLSSDPLSRSASCPRITTTPHHWAESMRATRCENNFKNARKSRDCAAIVASSISSLARCDGVRTRGFGLAELASFCCDFDFWRLIRLEGEEKSLRLNDSTHFSTHFNANRQSQCESTTERFAVVHHATHLYEGPVCAWFGVSA